MDVDVWKFLLIAHAIFEFFCGLITIIAVILSIYFIHRVVGCERIHVNFRIVLCCTAISFLVVPLVRRFIEILLFFSTSLTNRYNVNVVCVFLSCLSFTGGQSATICMLMLAFEQHLASRLVRAYKERSMCVGVALISFTLAFSVITSICLNYTYLKNFDLYHSTENCHPVAYHWQPALVFYSSSFVMCAIASIWLRQVRRYNQKQRKKPFTTLSLRYEQCENENSAMSITATVVGYLVYSFTGVAGSLARMVVAGYYGEHNKMIELLNELGYLLIELYALFHMACFVYFNNGMRKIVEKDLTRLCGKSGKGWCYRADKTYPKINSVQETSEHFRQLEAVWS